MPATLIVPQETSTRIVGYEAAISSGKVRPGSYLAARLAEGGKSFLHHLLDTKKPCIFAESAVAGDGSDWNATELSLLGDISVSLSVTVFDNGQHSAPAIHARPFQATLVYTPGALLRGRGTPADWEECTNGTAINPAGFHRLYERRLVPVFAHIQKTSAASGRDAIVTIPGLGCGCFAGKFQGKLGGLLEKSIGRILADHGGKFPRIRMVWFDPFNECADSTEEIHGISYRTRPLTRGNISTPQLCHPTAYQETGDDFSGCDLYSLVAWDHVSWPGNDFWAGSRATDDGVKAAATDSMFSFSGISGNYDEHRNCYLPPAPHRTWEDAVRGKWFSDFL